MRTNEELAAAIQAGEREALEQLWVQCYGFIRQQAIRWAHAWMGRADFDADDLTQCGYMALCKAVKAYQAERGNFINLLAYCLKSEFAKAAGCRTSAQLNEPLNNAISLDMPAYRDADSEATIADTIPFEEPGYEAAEESLQQAITAKAVREALYSLPERQRKAIEAHYLDGKTYAQIAEAMHVANSYPQQIVKDGLRRLRKGEHAPMLSELLWGERDFYKHTGFTAWKESGCSVQEWSLIWKEKEMRKYGLEDIIAGRA
ncbi:MAG: RNA polymerase sigma factor [Aristaeellaceae bacterium]